MRGTLILRRATRQDAPHIMQLEEDGIRTRAEELWGNWRPSATPETLDLTGHAMIEMAGVAVGCIACERHPDHVRIRKLYISAAHRRQGLGAMSLALTVQEAEARGLATRVSTLSTNTDAKRFYEREGFRVIETTAERILFEYAHPTHQGSE